MPWAAYVVASEGELIFVIKEVHDKLAGKQI